MKNLFIFIIGVVIGSAMTGIYIYHEIFLVWNDNQVRVEEAKIKLFNAQIKQLREGNIENVVAYFESEIEVGESNLKKRDEDKPHL